jgi:hypothetical protein
MVPAMKFFLEFDLVGAEWVVVAYLSGDANMLQVVNGSVSPHIITGSLISGLPQEVVAADAAAVKLLNDAEVIREIRATLGPLQEYIAQHGSEGIYLPRTMSIRQCGKKSNHGLNYGEGWFRFAELNEIEAAESKKIVELYTTQAYPGIPNVYWKGVQEQLRRDRTLTNCFGHRRRFLNAWEEELFKAGYSYQPQSTVAECAKIAQRETYKKCETGRRPWKDLDLIMNGHDSLTFSYPVNDWTGAASCAIFIIDKISPQLYYNGREFRLEVGLKVGPNKGVLKDVKISRDEAKLAKGIKQAWLEITGGKEKAA